MKAEIIDGKKIAENLKVKIANQVEEIKQKYNIIPTLAVILVGQDHASEIYVSNKEKAAHKVGMNSLAYKLSSDIKEEELIAQIEALNHDENVHGILVQLPLPKHINTNKVIHTIDPKKDVDGFNIINVGKLSIGEITGPNRALIPCTPKGCLHLIKDIIGEDLAGIDALVIGSSNIVGRPLARLLMLEKCTVTVANSSTKNLKEKTLSAQLIISAAGVPALIKADMVNRNAIIIDVGINRITLNDGSSKVVGDVDFENVSKVVKHITPVPGGVGPMTIAYLLQNTLECCLLKLSKIN